MAKVQEPVQALESVDESPKQKGDKCWNCANQDKKSYLVDGVCDVCGFDKNNLYNGNLEADKAAQKIEAAQAAERS